MDSKHRLSSRFTPDWELVRWQLPLRQLPVLGGIANGIHVEPISRFFMESSWALLIATQPAVVRMGEMVFPMEPGYACVAPPQTELVWEFQLRDGRWVAPYAHFYWSSPPTDPQDLVAVPAVQDLGLRIDKLLRQLYESIGYAQTEPTRAVVMLWDILWALSDGDNQVSVTTAALHPGVKQAMSLIESELDRPLAVADLARRAGISHNHLTRLFQQALGTSVLGYIRKRRAQRAKYLLTHTTRTIKSIAVEVGLHDFRRLNAVLRRELGKSPRNIRREDRSPGPASGT